MHTSFMLLRGLKYSPGFVCEPLVGQLFVFKVSSCCGPASALSCSSDIVCSKSKPSIAQYSPLLILIGIGKNFLAEPSLAIS